MNLTFKTTDQVETSTVYQVFQSGFSDYQVKVQMTEEEWNKRFFGPEGNQRELSVIAFDGATPAGLVFGGIRSPQGVKTIRCGTMCIPPEYRRRGIGEQLMQQHLEIGRNENCSTAFLEVINNNQPAVSLYKKLGYQVIHNLYYQEILADRISQLLSKKTEPDSSFQLAETSLSEMRDYRESLNLHLPWQSDYDFIQRLSEPVRHYLIKSGEVPVGGISISSTRIFFLYVSPEYRRQKIGGALLYRGLQDLNPEKLLFTHIENDLIDQFCSKKGFNYLSLGQYEMSLPLKHEIKSRISIG